MTYQREYYRHHKTDYLLRNRSRKRPARAFLAELKRTTPCVHCGESDPRCLDFGHEAAKRKVVGRSHMATEGASVAALRRELGKCIVLCKNCHAKEHFKR